MDKKPTTPSICNLASGVDKLSLGSGVEEPRTPVPPTTPPSHTKQGTELRSATKEIIYRTDEVYEEPDISEDYEAEGSSLLFSLSIHTEQKVHKMKVHHRSIEFEKCPSINQGIDEANVRALKKVKGVKDDSDILKCLRRYKNEYQRTKGTYNTLDALKRDKKEYEDLWQVRSMDAEQVCQEIAKIYTRVFANQKENGDGKCFIFHKEKEIIYVEELQCRVLKGHSTYCCEYDNTHSTLVYARIDLLLRLIYMLLKTDTSVNIRMIPYMYKENFNNISEVQYALDHICKGIGCTRDSLNIFASARGRIVGDIRIQVDGRSYATNCQSGTSIEPRDVARKLEIVALTKQKLLLILVVEKETIFQRLLEENFHQRFHCIIITGCGMPTVATRILLNKVQKQLDLPVVFLGDHNTGGLRICSSYLCGSKDMAYDSLNLCTPSMKWLGLSPSDLEKHGIPVGDEKVEGTNFIRQLEFIDRCPELANEVDKMKTKVDVEVMTKIYLKYLTEIYLPLKFQEMGQLVPSF